MSINFTENDIRPKDMFDEYLVLAEKDVKTFFNNVPYYRIDCPACGGDGKPFISKKGFTYDRCENCETLFVNPRPIKEAFDNYYRDSPSTEFWANKFYKITEDARREKLWKPKAKLVKELVEKATSGNKRVDYIIDIGGGYGIFAEEFSKISDISPIIIEPSVHLAQASREKGLKVIEKFIEDIKPEDLPEGCKCFVSFELFEHLHDPELFLERVYSVMAKGDVFIFTTLSGTGVDIQVLGANSKSVSPPHHLNFFNPKSVAILAQKVGFSDTKVVTPGKLDVDIMVNNLNYIDDIFWRSFLKNASSDDLITMQEAIQNLGISSHMMATLIK
jgi:SAM-dependent methyltransferase